MARPPSDNPRSVIVTIRVTESERERLDRDRGMLSLTDFIRSRLFGRKP